MIAHRWCALAIAIIVVTGSREQGILLQELVFVDIKELGLELGIGTGIIGVIAQQDQAFI